MLKLNKYKKISLTLGLFVILLGAISIYYPGFKYDIAFTGGTIIEASVGHEFSLEQVSYIFKNITGRSPSAIQYAGDGKTKFILKTNELSSLNRSEFLDEISDQLKIESPSEAVSFNSFSPAVNAKTRNSAILSIIIAIALLFVYNTLRYEMLSGIVAILTLIFNAFAIVLTYSVFRIRINMTFIALMLASFGYTIGILIIIFDRIRENRKTDFKEPFEDTVSKSVAQTFRRCCYTTVTALLISASLFFIGTEQLKSLALPLIVGIISGWYFSVFISGPLWAILRKLSKKKFV